MSSTSEMQSHWLGECRHEHVLTSLLLYTLTLIPMLYHRQEPVLFDASVKENIAFGKDDASDDEIIAAAKVANADEFISKFEGGYDYNVGTRGKKVSSSVNATVLCIL